MQKEEAKTQPALEEGDAPTEERSGSELEGKWIERLKEYEDFFDGVRGIDWQEDVIGQLKKYNISFDESYRMDQEWKTPKISLKIQSQFVNYLILLLQFQVGPYKTDFLFKYENKQESQNLLGRQLGKGGFGRVYRSNDNPHAVIKCIHLQANAIHIQHEELKQFALDMERYDILRTGEENEELKALRLKQPKYTQLENTWTQEILKNVQSQILTLLNEVFYMRLASAFKIGPQLVKLHQIYDFVITQHHFCFSMQKCTKLTNNIKGEQQDGLKKRLRRLHDLRVAHRDIKQSNLMEDRHGNILFVDFGSSEIITYTKRDIGLVQQTTYNLDPCCHEDIRSKSYSPAYPLHGSLYYYDMYALNYFITHQPQKPITAQQLESESDDEFEQQNIWTCNPLEPEDRLLQALFRHNEDKIKQIISSNTLNTNSLITKLRPIYICAGSTWTRTRLEQLFENCVNLASIIINEQDQQLYEEHSYIVLKVPNPQRRIRKRKSLH